MALPAFDTLKAANRLKAVGVPSAQAEAEAEVLSEIFEVNLKELATKEDLRATKEELRREINSLRKDMDVKHESLRKDMDAKFAAMEERSDAKYASLRKDMDIKFAKIDGELKLLKWILGFIAAGVASLVLKAFF